MRRIALFAAVVVLIGVGQVEGSVVVGWGYDLSGQVSDVPVGDDFTAIAAGRTHGLALKSDGSLVSWGGTFGA